MPNASKVLINVKEHFPINIKCFNPFTITIHNYLNFIFSINLNCYFVFSVIRMYCTFSTQGGHLNALPLLTTIIFEHK